MSRHYITALTLLIGLAACEDGQFKLPGGQNTQDQPLPSTRSSVVERDVEAPELFQKSDRGLWDGRPSLGGIWVAHEGVQNPERVIIRNSENGKFIIGALFRKEAATPGPKFQVSSEAAAALGMLAGAPTTLSVTALRREDVAATPSPDAPDAAPTTAPTDAPGAARPTPAAPSSTVAASTLDKPYVQLGIFSVQANANATKTRMQAAGVPVDIKESTSGGKTYYRVVLGPASSSSQRSELLSAAKSAGFADAYFTRN